ncbi:MAG TPA: DUF1330 domain-containing protein [Mycolicibacterium fallax]|nr:DUF1330 domain-containing protein [Mycolicibacterium fallax]
MAKAYIIVTEDITDPEGFKEYAKTAAGAMTPDVKVLAVAPQAEVIEGDWVGQTVVMEFEWVEAAKAWYYSDAHQAAAKLRQAAANCNAVIIPGF